MILKYCLFVTFLLPIASSAWADAAEQHPPTDQPKTDEQKKEVQTKESQDSFSNLGAHYPDLVPPEQQPVFETEVRTTKARPPRSIGEFTLDRALLSGSPHQST